MEAIQAQIYKYTADIVFTDKHGNIVLLVEAKTNQTLLNSSISQIKSYLSEVEKTVRFAMLVNLAKILILKVNGDHSFENKICLNTAEFLTYYNDEFSRKRIFSFRSVVARLSISL